MKKCYSYLFFYIICFYLIALQLSNAHDIKSGISPQVISLPKGPGSIEGLGESFVPQLNSGTTTYIIKLKVQPGRNNIQPDLYLQYNGGSGNSFFGLGWSLQIKYIQRQTDKGLPQYTDEDTFIESGGEELIHIGNNIYRHENETAFIKYQKTDKGWITRSKSGTQYCFGQTENSRISNNDKVLKWLLDLVIDTNGNSIHYHYKQLDTGFQKYCDTISFNKNDIYQHTIVFEYEKRPDIFSDYRPTFCLKTAYRCKSISMITLNQLVHRYEFDYFEDAYVSLLKSCRLIGNDSKTSLPPAEFTYTTYNFSSRRLITINGIDNDHYSPFLIMTNEPDLTLNDMNGDALPDLLHAKPGNHIVYMNLGIGDDGIHRFSEAKEMGNDSPGEALSNQGASLADIDGDGRTDFIARRSIDIFYWWRNSGTEKWESPKTFADNSFLMFSFENSAVRLLDVNHDKHIDVMYCNDSNGDIYSYFINNKGLEFNEIIKKSGLGNGMAFHQRSGMKLADMNGDRLQDIVLIQNGRIIYWPSSGIGEWDNTRNGGWSPGEIGTGTKMINPPDDESHDEPLLYNDWKDLMIVDLNGDGLSDIVYIPIYSDRMVYWLNKDSITFDGPYKINQLPYRREKTKIIPADMNGNGCIDILWNYPEDADTNNVWQYLELFPNDKPYLLKTASNGIGRKIIFHYSTSTQEFVRDQNSTPWKSGIPNATHVLSRFDIQDGMGQTYTTRIAYHDGYYDGFEKEFRGFEKVEQIDVGDKTARTLISEFSYHTGQHNEALKGKVKNIITQTTDKKIFYKEYNQWQTKTLLVDPENNQRSVSFPYNTTKTREILEKGSGTPVELKWEYEYDHFGNMTRLVELGRLDSGWDDERITVNTWSSAYTSGQSVWILDKLVDKKITDENEVLVSHEILLYDDNNTTGNIQKGNLTQIKKWVHDTQYVIFIRNEYDRFGNIIAAYDPLYGRSPGHYRRFIYDELFQTYPIREIIYTGKIEPEILIISASYHYGTGQIEHSTGFNGFSTFYSYDAFGRITSITKPHDTEHTIEYEYVMNHQSDNVIINWIETRQRDNSPEDGFHCSRSYFDGLGRKIMTRTEGEKPGQIVVTDTVIYNARQKPWKTYLPYFETNGTLNYVNPTYHTGYVEHFYDALGRIVQKNQPAGDEGVVFSKTSYEPLVKLVQDEEQTKENGIHSGCGMKYITDGLLDKDGNGRLRQVYEIVKLTDNGEPLKSPVQWLTTYSYNLNDLVIGYCDSQNNKKFISYDALGRKIWMNDPDKGQMHYTYDDAGNLIKTIDAKNQTIIYEYDGINRMIAEYYESNTSKPDVEYHYDLPSGPLDKGPYFQNNLSYIIAHAILFNKEYRQDYDLNNDQQIDVSDVVKAARENIMATGGLTQAENTKGLLAWVKDQSGETHFSYDGRARNKWTIRRIHSENHQAELNFYTENEYDSMDRVTQLIYPDGSSIHYKYNNRALLESIPGIINQLEYNPEGKNALLSLSCGVQTTYEYDHRLRLKRLNSKREVDALNLQDLHYVYDGSSNIVRINDNRKISTLKKIGNELGISDEKSLRFNATQSFEYDSLYRLIQASNPDVYGTIHYRYDRIGNMISKQAELIQTDTLMNLGEINSGGNMGSWNRLGRNAGDDPGPHAITGTEKGITGGLFVTYDDNGNMISNRGMTLCWDVKDRLIGLSKTGINAKYKYDYSDSRKSKIVIELEGNKTEVLYIDKFSEIRANQLRKYVYAGRNRIARVDGLDTNYHFYLHDHLGSVNLAIASNGEIFSQFVNYPYGKERFGVEKNTAEYRFTGKERDRESDLYYFEARYYENIIGIFIGVDPLSESIKNIKQLNSYRYCDNSPINNIDQDGKDTYSFQISLTGVIGSGGNLSFGWVVDDKGNVGYKIDTSLRGGAEFGAALMFGYSQKDTIRDLTGHGANVSADLWIFGTTVPLNHIDEEHLKKGEFQAGLGLGWPAGASIGYGVTGVLPLFNVKKPYDFIATLVKSEYELVKSMYNNVKEINKEIDLDAESFIDIISEMGGEIYNHGENVTITE